MGHINDSQALKNLVGPGKDHWLKLKGVARQVKCLNLHRSCSYTVVIQHRDPAPGSRELTVVMTAAGGACVGGDERLAGKCVRELDFLGGGLIF